jgi:hypothetical protein
VSEHLQDATPEKLDSECFFNVRKEQANSFSNQPHKEAGIRMTIIIAAEDTEQDLEDFAKKYDQANNPGEREGIAEETYGLIGDKIKGMIKRVGRGLGSDDLDGFAREAVTDALENSGVTKIKRSDGVWETLIQREKDRHPVAKRIWGMLRRRDFFNAAAWVGVSLPGEARVMLDKGVAKLSGTELSRFNALALSAACPEITIPNEPPPRSIMGYVSKFWLPSAKSRIAELGGAPPMQEYLIEAKNALKPVMEQLRQMEVAGTMPPELAGLGPAQRIYTLFRQIQQKRFGPTIQWFNERIRELQPQHPFVVDSPPSLREAKELLRLNPGTVKERLWKEKGAPYFLPASVFEPFGLSIIQRVLDSSNGGAIGRVQRENTSPSAQSSGDMQAAKWLRDGHQSRTFQWLVGRLFEQHEIEYLVGMFLAQHVKPSRQDIDRFTENLPDDMADDVDSCGWNNLVLSVDQAVLNAIRDPEIQAEITQAFKANPATVMAMVDCVRRAVFCRKSDFILNSRLAAIYGVA